MLILLNLFQSTLPSQGATRTCRSNHKVPEFQSTLPSQGATLFRAFDTRPPQISIHAPLTGSDLYRMRQGRYGILISIHAPLTGSDTVLGYDGDILVKFQSTLPSQGATVKLQMNLVNKIFQSTLPSQGATSTAGASALMSADFNPRSPHRERPLVLHPFRLPKIFQSTLPSQGATWSTL